MTDYLEKYREALRAGDEEKANEYYRKYRGDEEKATEESSEEEGLKSPGDMNVGEAKDYADELGDGEIEEFLEQELSGKDRTTLVDYLESKVE